MQDGVAVFDPRCPLQTMGLIQNVWSFQIFLKFKFQYFDSAWRVYSMNANKSYVIFQKLDAPP